MKPSNLTSIKIEILLCQANKINKMSIHYNFSIHFISYLWSGFHKFCITFRKDETSNQENNEESDYSISVDNNHCHAIL